MLLLWSYKPQYNPPGKSAMFSYAAVCFELCNQNISYFVKSVSAFKGCHLPSTEKWCNLVFSILYLVLYNQFKKYIFLFFYVFILYLLSSNIILSKNLHYCFYLICLSILIQSNHSEYFLELFFNSVNLLYVLLEVK